MPTSPYAKLLVSINGAAAQSGGITVPASATVAFTFQDTNNWRVYVLTMRQPPGASVPAGWTDLGDGTVSYTGVTTPPPTITLPAITGWGKWMLELVVNGTSKNGVAGDPDMTDTTTALSMLSVNAIEDTGTFESNQFSPLRVWGGPIQRALRLLDSFLSAGGAVVDATTTVKGIVKLAGDLAGTALLPVVAKINGVAVTGTPSTGYVPTATSSSAATWQAQTGAALSTNTPQDIGTASAGTGTAASKDGHIHAHGNQASAAALLHALVVPGGNPGFMSGADKAALDALLALPPGLLAKNVLCSAGTPVASVDQLIYTVPASPSGPNRGTLAALTGRMKTALVGAGTVTVRAGTTAGGNDLLVDKAVTSASAVGLKFGKTLTELGTAFDPLDGYTATLAAGATVYVRMTTAGTVTTAPTFEFNAPGYLEGT